MSIISDVNGKIARLGTSRHRSYSHVCRPILHKKKRIKFIGRMLEGKHLYNEFRKPRNFLEMTQIIRWNGRN